MNTVNIHEAKTHLSQLVMLAAAGNPFIIAKAGKPLVKVVPLQPQDTQQLQRLGFMQGECIVPDDFDRLASHEIVNLCRLSCLNPIQYSYIG
jgi:prevent-host-death family protein